MMDTFSVRDLRERSGDLVRQAEEGRLSIVAKHGHPLFVAVPLDEHLLSEGVAVAMACRLFAEHTISLGKAAKLAGLPIERFIAVLGAMGIPTVDLTPAELDQELAALA
jgi:prevent-host-death family protein